MEPHQERVVNELAELRDKREKLESFINGSSTFQKLPDDEKARLQKQLGFMSGYQSVLQERIDNF